MSTTITKRIDQFIQIQQKKMEKKLKRMVCERIQMPSIDRFHRFFFDWGHFIDEFKEDYSRWAVRELKTSTEDYIHRTFNPKSSECYSNFNISQYTYFKKRERCKRSYSTGLSCLCADLESVSGSVATFLCKEDNDEYRVQEWMNMETQLINKLVSEYENKQLSNEDHDVSTILRLQSARKEKIENNKMNKEDRNVLQILSSDQNHIQDLNVIQSKKQTIHAIVPHSISKHEVQLLKKMLKKRLPSCITTNAPVAGRTRSKKKRIIYK